jgi:hypothetical protein
MSKQDLNNYLSLTTDLVVKNTKVVHVKDLPNKLLHISTNRQKVLIPNISQRASLGEDNTIPRVHTAPTILGCIAGYGNAFYDGRALHQSGTKNAYRGGYYLYTIPFEYALRPNAKLVPDVAVTNEYWLIPYSKEYSEYTPDSISKMVTSDVTTINLSNGDIENIITFYIEITSDTPVLLDTDILLETGFYIVKINFIIKYDAEDRNDDLRYNVISHEPTTKNVFKEKKDTTAALLSYSRW